VRIFSTHPPVNAATITRIGSTAWRTALETNVQLYAGTRLLSYACWIGNQPSFSPRK